MDLPTPLAIAIDNERAEAAFYRRAAAGARDRAAAALFALLADQEEHHQTLLEDLSRRLARVGAWPERIADPTIVAEVAATLEQLARLGAAAADADPDQTAALDQAIEFERRAEVFYRDLADRGVSGPERSFFLALAGVERDHRRWIEQFRAAIGGRGGR